MKYIKLNVFLIAAMLFSLALSGCTGGNKIHILLSGTEPDGFKDVLKQYYKQAGSDAVKLDVEWVLPGDMKDVLNKSLLSGEDYDLVFDSPTLKINDFTKDGIYAPLEDYILYSDSYPNLKNAYPEEAYKANYYYGHLYAIPIMNKYGGSVDCIYYRQDLSYTYGIGIIDSMEKYKEYLEAVLKHDSAVTPLSLTSSKGFGTLFDSDEVEMAKDNIAKISIGGNAYVLLNDDKSEVVDIVYEGESVESYKNFPQKYSDGSLFGRNRVIKNKEWNKYIEPDSLNEIDSVSDFKNGETASIIDTLDNYEAISEDIKNSAPDAEIGVFIINDKFRSMEEDSRITDFKANNFIAIPASSKKIDKTLKFLDRLFASQKNHDLFELGIEGKDWEAVGDDQYMILASEKKSKDSPKNYSFPGNVLTWNPKYVRFSSKLPQDILDYKRCELKDSSYFVSPLAGFKFNPEEVQNELNSVNSVISETMPSLEHGVLENPVKSLEEMELKAKDAGQDIIKEELKNQINDFLSENS